MCQPDRRVSFFVCSLHLLSHYIADLTRKGAEDLLRSQPQGTFVVRKSSKPHSWVVSLQLDANSAHLLVVPRSHGERASFGLDPETWGEHELGSEEFVSSLMLVRNL